MVLSRMVESPTIDVCTPRCPRIRLRRSSGNWHDTTTCSTSGRLTPGGRGLPWGPLGPQGPGQVHLTPTRRVLRGIPVHRAWRLAQVLDKEAGTKAGPLGPLGRTGVRAYPVGDQVIHGTRPVRLHASPPAQPTPQHEQRPERQQQEQQDNRDCGPAVPGHQVDSFAGVIPVLLRVGRCAYECRGGCPTLS